MTASRTISSGIRRCFSASPISYSKCGARIVAVSSVLPLNRSVHTSSGLFTNLGSFNMLTTNANGPKRFKSLEYNGFNLSGVFYTGPIFVLNDYAFLWDVSQFGLGGGHRSENTPAAQNLTPFEGWTKDVFSALALCEEKPEILVLGTGSQLFMLPPALKAYIFSLGIQVEICSSNHAVNTYNVLCEEGRRVAFAGLPLVPTCARTGQALVEVHTD